MESFVPLLITGIAGVPGYNALHYFRAKYPGQVFGIRQEDNLRLTGPGVVACNAEDHDGLARLFDRQQFAAVLNCAGNCALRACELDPALAWRINVEGVQNLLSQTVPRGLPLVHLSVDMVFSGERDGGYVETDPTDPVTVYGKTMAVAEQAVLEADPSACVLRISLPMGTSSSGHAGAIDWITSRFKKGRPATLYFDEIRTPTYTDCMNALYETVLARGVAGAERRACEMGTESERRTVLEETWSRHNSSTFRNLGAVPQPFPQTRNTHDLSESRDARHTECAGYIEPPTADSAALSGLYHAGGPRRLTLYQIAQVINRVGGYDPCLLHGCLRREAGPIPPRAGNVSMDCTKLIAALGYNPFDPWPLYDDLVPGDLDWHYRRPTDDPEPGSAGRLYRLLCRNPARRHRGDDGDAGRAERRYAIAAARRIG